MTITSLAFGGQMIRGVTKEGRRYIVYVSKKGVRKLGAIGFLDLFFAVALASSNEFIESMELCKTVEAFYINHNFCGFYSCRQALMDHVCYTIQEDRKYTSIHGKTWTAIKFALSMCLRELFSI